MLLSRGKIDIVSKNRSQKIGKLGQDALGIWAHQANFTVTKPSEDEQGWDYLLEGDPPELSTQPLRASYDKRSFPAKIWIQVKSTDDTSGSYPVKLDNWERLVKTPYPAFFSCLCV